MNIDLQLQVIRMGIPAAATMASWLSPVLDPIVPDAELSVRVVDLPEMIALNSEFRGKDKPTNVLSFPFEVPDGVEDCHLLGDIVICADVLAEEAEAQDKSIESHWAHLIIHGAYHLLGYDHITDEDAEKMEGLEIIALAQLGFDNPYEEITNDE